MSEESMLPHSHTLQRAANVPAYEILRVLMTTVGDLTVSISSNSAQQQHTDEAEARVVDILAQRQGAAVRRPEFWMESAHCDGVGDVKAWIRTLELIYDVKWLTIEERFLHTIPVLAKSALKVYEYSHPTTYPESCHLLIQRRGDKYDRFHKFQDLAALRRHGEGLDAYIDKFMELDAQVPDMSPQDSLAIYFGGLEASVRSHLLGAQHVSTLEKALLVTRIFANAHHGFGGPSIWPVCDRR